MLSRTPRRAAHDVIGHKGRCARDTDAHPHADDPVDRARPLLHRNVEIDPSSPSIDLMTKVRYPGTM